MKIDDKEKTALVEGAREAEPQNPSIWDQIADYFAAQYGSQVLPEPPLHIPVVALLSEYDHEVALRCLRGGACGCLIQPFDSEQLQPLLLRVGYIDQDPEAPASNKVLCVLPAKGSCGATTLAASLACQAARSGHKRILLADFDPVAGTLAFVLKLKSSYSFVDALT